MNAYLVIKKRFQSLGIVTLIGTCLMLASCGGGGSGSSSGGNGNGGGGGNNTATTYSSSLTEIELQDTRNGRVFTTSNLPAAGATITKN